MKNFEKAIDRVIAKLFECTEELKQCNKEMQQALEGKFKNEKKEK